jgi:hypothetical protein
VHLPSADEKIFYKFVVDDEWITDHEAPQEEDGHFNINNVLYPNEIKKDAPPPSEGTDAGAAILSSAAPENTTAALAGEVPLEKAEETVAPISSAAPESTAVLEKAEETVAPTISSAAPESTTAALAGEVPLEKAEETVAPTISSAAPESTTAELASEVPLEKTEETVAPTISSTTPESTTAVLAGEVPLEKAEETVAPTVSSAAPESTTAVLAGEVPLEKVEETVVPTISSAAPESTTAALAGEVPLEKVEETVVPTVSSAAPESTTAALAGEVPLEKVEETVVPTVSSAAPESTTAVLAGEVPLEEPQLERQPETTVNEPDSFKVAPIPATSGVGNAVSVPAGEKIPEPSTITSNTIHSTATTSKEDYEKDASAPFPPPSSEPDSFKVAPIPATSSIGNIISLPAGEAVPDPSTITSNNVESTVTTSKEDYEKDASAPFPPTSSEPDSFKVAPIPATPGIGNVISLPAGEAVPDPSTITSNTVESTVTTSKEGYEHAGETAAGVLGGTAIGAAALSAFSKPDEKEKNIIPESSLPMDTKAIDTVDTGPTISSVAPTSTTAQLAGAVPLEKKRQGMVIEPTEAPSSDVAPSVPEVVQESIKESHEEPEAAAETSVVAEKAAVEQELLKSVPKAEETGEPAPIVAATSATAPAVEKKAAEPVVETSKKSDIGDASPDTVDSKKKAPEPSATSATSTPVKKPASSAASSPATSSPTTSKSATKEKKKKHRISGFFKRIFD